MPSSNTSDWDMCIRTSSSECSNGALKGGSEWEWASVIHFYQGCNTHTATHNLAPKKYYMQLTVFVFLVKRETDQSPVVTCASHAQHNTWWNLPAPDNRKRCGGSRGGKAWLHRSFSHWAVRGRVDVCLEGESYQICTHHWHDSSAQQFSNEWHCAPQGVRALFQVVIM